MYCPYCKSEYKEGVLECPYCDTPLIQSPAKLDTKTPSHPSDYLNDLEEWNNNQYNPGYWLGGKIPPHIKVLNKAGGRTIGIISLISGIIMLIFTIESMLTNSFQNPEDIILALTGNIVGGFFGILLVWAGIQRIKGSNTKN